LQVIRNWPDTEKWMQETIT